ncbi:Endonuclease-reverse transcriptase [Operophtera brumata]|uniref:Endonuclease-reverse transcriptase n=1 Tax=Operophtera brumata TaxID=104452 RepID=A0A0L7L095_OPEBR|nr:Endonuclease-reverse transcriptase [Operophtera brumata]
MAIAEPIPEANPLKDLILKARKEAQSQDITTPKKEWITEETWKAIRERKELLVGKVDSVNAQYQSLSAKVQRLCRRDYSQYLNSICLDIENHAQYLHTRDLFQKVKSITREFKPKTWAIEDREGNLLTEIDQITERWRSYLRKPVQRR